MWKYYSARGCRALISELCCLPAERALNTLAAAVTDWSEDKSKREALVQIGRSVLIKWLLSRALDDDQCLEQVEAEHALLNLLADGELTVHLDSFVFLSLLFDGHSLHSMFMTVMMRLLCP